MEEDGGMMVAEVMEGGMMVAEVMVEVIAVEVMEGGMMVGEVMVEVMVEVTVGVMVEVMVGVMEEVMVGVMVEVMMEVMVKVMVVVMIEVMVGIMVGVTVEATALEMADVCSLVLFYLVLCVALSVNVKDIHDALTHLKSSMSTIRIRKSCPVISYSETSRGRIFIVVSISLSMGYVNQVSFIQCTVSATASVSTRLSTAVWCSLQSGRLPCIDLSLQPFISIQGNWVEMAWY